MIQDLFTFPIVMVDGENEERKEQERESYLNLTPNGETPDVEYDIVYGEAEYPYYDFVGVEDRWLPTKKSLSRALKGKFDACLVRFENVGQFLVPWNKSKFKEEISKFTEQREKVKDISEDTSKVTVLKFTPEVIADIIKKADAEGD